MTALAVHTRRPNRSSYRSHVQKYIPPQLASAHPAARAADGGRTAHPECRPPSAEWLAARVSRRRSSVYSLLAMTMHACPVLRSHDMAFVRLLSFSLSTCMLFAISCISHLHIISHRLSHVPRRMSSQAVCSRPPSPRPTVSSSVRSAIQIIIVHNNPPITRNMGLSQHGPRHSALRIPSTPEISIRTMHAGGRSPELRAHTFHGSISVRAHPSTPRSPVRRRRAAPGLPNRERQQENTQSRQVAYVQARR